MLTTPPELHSQDLQEANDELELVHALPVLVQLQDLIALQALREQRVEVAEWYGSMKASMSESWSHMKQGFSDAYKDLANAWEKSEKEYRSDN